MTPIVRVQAAAALALVVFLSALPAQETPQRTDLEESVKVRLVTIDALVVDAQDRTVPDLTKGDFLLFVDGEPRAIDTLDVNCSVGAIGDPRERKHREAGQESADPKSPRHLALVIDYMHLGQIDRAKVLDQAAAIVREVKSESDRVLLAALTGGIRIELPFTDDEEAILTALKRMQNDITLWNGNFEHMDDDRFFEGLYAALSVLETQVGSKALLLFSSVLFAPGDRSYDQEFAELAAEASVSRTAIYPVEAAGLTAQLSPGPWG